MNARDPSLHVNGPREGTARVDRFPDVDHSTPGTTRRCDLDRPIVLDDHPPSDIPQKNLAELAERIYRSRQIRASFLHSSLLGEPVWDMLLTLYFQGARGEPLSVSGLCYSAGVPPTTALRWAQLLEQKQLIIRTPDAKDARRAHLTLSDHGHALMSAYLATVYNKLSDLHGG